MNFLRSNNLSLYNVKGLHIRLQRNGERLENLNSWQNLMVSLNKIFPFSKYSFPLLYALIDARNMRIWLHISHNLNKD